MAITRTRTQLLAAGTTLVPATPQRAILAVGSDYGGLVTMKITNGGTPPSAQAVCNVLASHETTQPAAGSAGADWKTLWSFGGGTTLNAVTEQNFEFGPGVRFLEIEFKDNTVQNVTVEAFATTYVFT